MRYALYYSPAEDHPLTAAASRWLGRDAFLDGSFPTPDVSGLACGDVHQLTADPRRYGFHATLKAPFELAPGKTEAELLAALAAFAAATPAFTIPNVILGQLGRFFAIVPDRIYPELQDFAARVVADFEPFRAPLSEADIARRKPEKLPPAQRAYLDRWGYPYVMDEFRFHMTLTGSIRDEAVRDRVLAALQAYFADETGSHGFDGIAIFKQAERSAPFTILERFAFKSTVTA